MRNVVRRGARAVPPWGREVLLSLLCMSLLVVAVFPDVVFMGRTTATSAFSPGVLGSPPHAGYPADAELDRNAYLRDPLASAIASEPAAEYVSRVVDDPGLALWDPYRSLGQPFLATGDPQLVSPIRWPLAAVPTPTGWDAFILLRLVAIGVLVHLLAWRFGWSRWSSISASVVATAGGFTALHVNSVHVDQLLALLLAMHAGLWFARSRSPGPLLAVSGAGVLVLLADNLQAGVLGLLFVAAFVVHLLHREGLDLRRIVGWAALVVALPALLASFVVVPMVELAGSPLTEGLSVHRHLGGRLVGTGHLPLQALADYLVPDVGHGATPGFDINLGIGLLVAYLAVLGARRPGPHRRFLVAVAVLLLLKTFGALLVNSIGRLPVLSSINFKLYGAPLLQLTLALLAGAGVERLRERAVTVVESLAVAAVTAVAATALVVWRLPQDVDRTGLVVAHLLLLGAAALVVAVGVTTARGWWPGAAVTVLVVLQVTLLWLPRLGAVVTDATVERALALPVVDRPLRTDPFTPPQFVTELQRRTSPEDRIVARGGLLFPNSAGVFGLRDLRGASGFTVARFHALVTNFIDPRDPWRFDGRHWDALIDPAADARFPEVLDLLSVEWIVSHGPIPDVPEADRHPELRRFFAGDHAVLYRNPDAQPYARLVHDAVAVDSLDAAVEVMQDPRVDLRTTAVLETSRLPELASPGEDPGTVVVDELHAASARFVVETPTPAVLVVSETYYPGWRARVDGAPAEVLPAYGALRAVAVPAGSSVVEFAFRPTSVLVGAAVSGATLAGLLLAAGVSAWRRRRRDEHTVDAGEVGTESRTAAAPASEPSHAASPTGTGT